MTTKSSKKSLYNNNRKIPETKDLNAAIDEYWKEGNDRVAAILHASILESFLTQYLMFAFKLHNLDLEDDEIEELFFSPKSSLKDFRDKIEMGYIIGLYDKTVRGDIDCIRRIRKASTLIPIIREKVLPDSIVYTDSFRAYDVLDVSEFHHRRVNHSKTFVSPRGHHINGIENFWNQAKRHLRRFNGIPKDSFYGFLKECEWRFNGGGHKALLHQLKRWYQSEINKP